jgi:iron complex outermembrane receptor protein
LRNLSPIGPDRLNDLDYLAVRASIVADLTPDLENYTIASYNRSDTRGTVNKALVCTSALPPLNVFDSSTVGPNFFAPSACDNIAAQDAAGYYTVHSAVPNPRSKVTTWQIINTTTWQASDALVVKNIVSYAEQRQTIQSSVFGIYATVRPNLPNSYAAYPGEQFHMNMINPLPRGANSSQSTFTEELQLQGGSGDGRLVWQAGGYMELSDPLDTSGNQTAGSINCADVATFECTDVLSPTFSVPFGMPIPVGFVNETKARTKFRNYGVYGQATYELVDRLKLTAGLRYTWDKMSTDTQLIVNNIIGGVAMPTRCGREDVTPPDCRSIASVSSDEPTWVLGLDYTPIDDVLLYAKYSRGYRAGGLKIDGPVEYTTFEPEKLDTYEIGLKSSFRGAIRGTFNLAGFYNDFSNQQIHFGFSAKPGRGVASTAGAVNAGKSRLYGFEADLNLIPLEGLVLTGSYTYLKTEIRAIDPVTLPPASPYEVQALVTKGDPLLLAPKHKLSVGASYTLPIDDSIGQITFGATYVYTSEQLSNYVDRFFVPLTGGVNYSVLPATDLVNVNVNWNSVAGAPVDVSFFATNVTKEKYATFYDGLFAGTGFETGALGEPRMYGVRVKYRFGN